MVDAARERGVDAHVGDVRTWTPQPDTDVVVTNATLQWVPEHAELLVRWAGQLARRVVDRDAGARKLRRTVASGRPRARRAAIDGQSRCGTSRFARVRSTRPVGYAELLTDAGCTVDAWETTYIHELSGENPVLEWITGTALRPVRSRLTDEQWQQFRQELIPMLDEAYPARADGKTFFPFRRIFVVAQV